MRRDRPHHGLRRFVRREMTRYRSSLSCRSLPVPEARTMAEAWFGRDAVRPYNGRCLLMVRIFTTENTENHGGTRSKAPVANRARQRAHHLFHGLIYRLFDTTHGSVGISE